MNCKDSKEQKDAKKPVTRPTGHTQMERVISVIVNISGIRQYYQTRPGLFLQVSKSHQLELLISFTGCCARCSVVAVICVCLLVYQDYAATYTGVGNQQMSEFAVCPHLIRL